MSEYNILGNDNFHLAELFSTIYMLENEVFTANVIENIPVEQRYPFLSDHVNYNRFFYDEWDPRSAPSKPYVLGVAQPKTKKIVFDFFQQEYKLTFSDFMSVIHPNSVIAPTAKYGNGMYMNPLSTIGAFSEIGQMVTISNRVSIGHHICIKDYCKINPGVNIASQTVIGSGVTIGMGATILNSVTIGSNSFIGAGSLVTRDIPSNVLAYGSPARVIKHLD